MSFASVDITDHPTSGANSAMTSTEEPTFSFLPVGAVLQKFELNGLNIVQGFEHARDYKEYNEPYFGETIGRVANRISGARINRLNGRSYDLSANNGPNCLHGGGVGWGKCAFEGPISVTRNGKEQVHFKYLSRNGEEGFPGSVEARVFYTASTINQDGHQVATLEIEYEAELVGDENVYETVVAMTNHRYTCLQSANDEVDSLTS
jgi:aldose 1-epimerase